ncbi:acetyltransferase (GNAT) family protein [Streptomyces sp. TLI_55]|uniref:GNAT family N-acetyltransferase n=1 Tax=Streptomyces sp. TLI_55 TaxID=1938861 RepID=UPI000BDB05A5|nr:GNAT family N-acetyltransferase [Streptomyces sp. TLI_55]SNX88379.1 acetyltransferase (GNAT) family protein [Streptomyces sp. TLI_55]
MTNKQAAIDAAEAFQAATEQLVDSLPNGFHERGPAGALLAVTGSLIPLLNTVMSASDVPDVEEIKLLCGKAEPHVRQLPWSIRLRGEVGEEITDLAAQHGLTTRTKQPFMLLSLEEKRPDTRQRGESVTVRRLDDEEHETFAEVLGTAFGAPPAIITSLYTPHVLGRPFVKAYVAEADGTPVAAGLGVVTERHVGLANIGTLPAHRRRGVGRAVVEAILRDARAAGAHTAYLHSSDEALPLFEQAGFRTEESWVVFSA